MDMTIQDLMAYKEISEGGKWGMNTALWVIVAAIVFIAFFWYVHKNGENKADLAASIQGLYGRVNAIEPAVTAQGNSIYALNGVVSAAVQGVGNLKNYTEEQLAALNGAVFTPRCGTSHCGGNSRFVKTDNYCLSDSSLQAIETCNS